MKVVLDFKAYSIFLFYTKVVLDLLESSICLHNKSIVNLSLWQRWSRFADSPSLARPSTCTWGKQIFLLPEIVFLISIFVARLSRIQIFLLPEIVFFISIFLARQQNCEYFPQRFSATCKSGTYDVLASHCRASLGYTVRLRTHHSVCNPWFTLCNGHTYIAQCPCKTLNTNFNQSESSN